MISLPRFSGTLLDGLVDDGHGVTANRTLTNLKTFFDWCVKRDLRDSSPVAALDAPAEETERERKLTAAELVAAWKVADREGYWTPLPRTSKWTLKP